MFRVVRFTVRRITPVRSRAPWAFAAGLGVLAAGSVMAAPGLDFSALAGMARDGYAVRFVLPDAHRSAPLAATPAARQAPLAEITETPDAGDNPASAPLAAASTLPVPTVARTSPRSKVPGVIALSYSLTGGAEAGDAIEVNKPVSIAGADAGRVPIRIDGNAKVYAQGKRLAAIIAAQSGENAVPAGLGEDFVSLEALRALGIGVRYDAIRDRLVVEPPAV
ncbi:MAG: hypothetical protein Q8R44_07245 [Novosphingobium sp.]|nr:hypothetical protein [Novosphingobium sp.]